MASCSRSCKICASPCREGEISHGRGCLHLHESGGGVELCDEDIHFRHVPPRKIPAPEGGRVPFTIDALNPITGKRDGIQYTFGESHVAQALARYAEAANQIGAIKTSLQHYIDGLKILGGLPESPTRHTLFLAWKGHWEPIFSKILSGKGRTYLLNHVATYYRQYLNNKNQP